MDMRRRVVSDRTEEIRVEQARADADPNYTPKKLEVLLQFKDLRPPKGAPTTDLEAQLVDHLALYGKAAFDALINMGGPETKELFEAISTAKDESGRRLAITALASIDIAGAARRAAGQVRSTAEVFAAAVSAA